MAYRSAPPGWWEQFVMAEPARTAKLGVIRADGSPAVLPVWVALDPTPDGPEIVFNTGLETLKGRAIARDPRVSLCWDDERPPFSFVTVHGVARLVTDPAQVGEWATRLGGRYMGAEHAAEYGARNGVAGECLVRVRPERVIAMVDLAS